MRKHALALAASAAAITAAASPMPAAAQDFGLGNLFSCQSTNGKAGTIIGGIAGALAGSQISKNERTLGAVLGAGLGAWAGNQIGCRMNDNGRAEATGAVERALNTGRTQTWYDARTGARGRVEVESTGYDSRYASTYDNRYGAAYAGQYSSNVSATDLRYGRGVVRVNGSMRQAAPMYRSSGRVNVRAAPTTRSAVVDQLRPGEEIRVAGMVNDGWLVVEQNGWVRGYVADFTVDPVTTAYVRNTDSRYDCRIVRQTISQRGYQTETQRFNACRSPGGDWRINPI